MSHVLIPGSFDPPTRGHETLIRRACDIFDRVTVGLFINPDKEYLFSEEERRAFLHAICDKYPNVSVISDGGMVADYARAHAVDALCKGIRNQADLTYENEMAAYNLSRGVPTLYLYAEAGTEEVSSTAVREALAQKKELQGLLSPEIYDKVREIFEQKQNND